MSSAYDDDDRYRYRCELLGVQPVTANDGWLDTNGIHAKAVGKICDRFLDLQSVAEMYKRKAVERLKLGYMDGEA